MRGPLKEKRGEVTGSIGHILTNTIDLSVMGPLRAERALLSQKRGRVEPEREDQPGPGGSRDQRRLSARRDQRHAWSGFKCDERTARRADVTVTNQQRQNNKHTNHRSSPSVGEKKKTLSRPSCTFFMYPVFRGIILHTSVAKYLSYCCLSVVSSQSTLSEVGPLLQSMAGEHSQDIFFPFGHCSAEAQSGL